MCALHPLGQAFDGEGDRREKHDDEDADLADEHGQLGREQHSRRIPHRGGDERDEQRARNQPPRGRQADVEPECAHDRADDEARQGEQRPHDEVSQEEHQPPDGQGEHPPVAPLGAGGRNELRGQRESENENGDGGPGRHQVQALLAVDVAHDVAVPVHDGDGHEEL